jgi:hypothetical protein
LIYTKFVTLSQSIRPLVAELEHRSSINPDELRATLSECHSAYISTRQGLLGARVSDEVGRLDPRNSDLVDLVRQLMSPMTRLTIRHVQDAAISSRLAWTNSTCTNISSFLVNHNYSTSPSPHEYHSTDWQWLPGITLRPPVRPSPTSNPTRTIPGNTLWCLYRPTSLDGPRRIPRRRRRRRYNHPLS